MPHTIHGLNQYSPNALVPSDGDPGVSASVEVPFQTILNNTTYAATQVGHQMMDDRGKTSNMVGVVTINNSGGSFVFEVPMRFNNDIDFYGDVDVHAAGAFSSHADALLAANATIGSSSTNTLQVNATLNVSAPAAFHGDVSITGGDLDIHNDTTITADLTVNGSVQLGSDPGSQTVGVGAPLVVSELARFLSDVNINGNANIGNNSTDSHQIRGTVECTGDVSVEGTFESNTETNLREVNVSGQFTANGDANFRQDVVLGETDADSITFNGLIDSPVGFRDAGRILKRVAAPVNGTAHYTPLDGDTLFVRTGDITAPVAYTFESTSLSKGDHWTISNLSPYTITVNSNIGIFLIQQLEWAELLCLADGAGWSLFRYGVSQN